MVWGPQVGVGVNRYTGFDDTSTEGRTPHKTQATTTTFFLKIKLSFLMVTLLLLYLHIGSVLSYRMKKVKSCAILLFFHPHTALPWSDGLLPLFFFLVRSGDDLVREHHVWEEVPRLPSSDGFLGSILLPREW